MKLNRISCPACVLNTLVVMQSTNVPWLSLNLFLLRNRQWCTWPTPFRGALLRKLPTSTCHRARVLIRKEMVGHRQIIWCVTVNNQTGNEESSHRVPNHHDVSYTFVLKASSEPGKSIPINESIEIFSVTIAWLLPLPQSTLSI